MAAQIHNFHINFIYLFNLFAGRLEMLRGAQFGNVCVRLCTILITVALLYNFVPGLICETRFSHRISAGMEMTVVEKEFNGAVTVLFYHN